MDSAYIYGQQLALIKLGYSRMPGMSEENLGIVGDTQIPEKVRMNVLRSHLQAAATRKLPGKAQYEQEGQSTGRLTGGILGGGTGGLAGAAVADLRGSGGRGAAGWTAGLAAAGALGGAYLGGRAGKSIGAGTHAEDVGEKQRAYGILANNQARKVELARKVYMWKQHQAMQQQAHAMDVAREGRSEVNVYNDGPRGY